MATTIYFEINKVTKQCETPCPVGACSDLTGAIRRVGSVACNRCPINLFQAPPGSKENLVICDHA